MMAAFYKKYLMLNFYSSNGISGYRYSHTGVCVFALLHCGAVFAVPSTNTGREEHNYEIQMNYAIEFTEILIMFGNKSGL